MRRIEDSTEGRYETDFRPFNPDTPLPYEINRHQPAAERGGVSQWLGLAPISTGVTLAVNAMMFGAEVVTGGALIPAALGVAVVVGVIVYRAQKRFYGDDHEAALVKALAVGLLTAIPTGLPAFLTVPSGVVGLVHTLRRRVN